MQLALWMIFGALVAIFIGMIVIGMKLVGAIYWVATQTGQIWMQMKEEMPEDHYGGP